MKRREFIKDTSKAILGGFIGTSVLANAPLQPLDLVKKGKILVFDRDVKGIIENGVRLYQPHPDLLFEQGCIGTVRYFEKEKVLLETTSENIKIQLNTITRPEFTGFFRQSICIKAVFGHEAGYNRYFKSSAYSHKEQYPLPMWVTI